ncbi:MAG TPA: dockerin type I domain-containing protein, partial [Candidatus Nanoarchaeia archaeon]
DTIDVTVSNDTGGPSPPTANIKANGSNGPITITYNTSATISWTSTNATSCSVSPTGWTGVSGSKSTGRLTTKKTYTLSCLGEGGSASDLVAITVAKLGDLNLDGRINIRDLSILLSRWGSTNATADINGDGRVNIRDLSVLLSRWGG